jgi:hypothetical protein
MNQDRIKQMAEQAAATHGHTIKATPEIMETLTAFAALVAEDCAGLCDLGAGIWWEGEGAMACEGVARDIRARYCFDSAKGEQ